MVRQVSLVLAVVTFVASAVLLFGQVKKETDLGPIGDFVLDSTSGEKFSNQDLEGQTSVVNFMFTSCKGPCPLNSKEISAWLKTNPDRKNILFVSITVDPETDTLAVLEEYKKEYVGDDPRWILLRGEKPEVKRISNEIFKLALEDDPNSHSPRFTILNRKARIKAFVHKEKLSSLLNS